MLFIRIPFIFVPDRRFYLRAIVCGIAAALLMAAAPAAWAKFQPAVLYDIGGKFDKSLNEGVANGAALFRRKTGLEIREIEINTETQREQALRNMARRGDDPIVAVGAAQAPALEKVAGEFPRVRFVIIGGTVKAPNVQSIVFRGQEGAFLVGALAAMTSKSRKIGFIGGMDAPEVRKMACGYTQGARYVAREITVLQNMAGTTRAAWKDPIKGAELAKAQFDRGVDIVYHAAAGTGLGVLQAAADAGRFGIGNEFNQNGLHPGRILTSMIRRADVATYNTFKTAAEGTWRPGVLSLGLAERGIGWMLDRNNAGLVSAKTREVMERIKTSIASGKIRVHDYTRTRKCPF
jgi:basic membrane protein A